MSEIDHKKLRELAEAATPGLWTCRANVVEEPSAYLNAKYSQGANCRNAEFIAAANPATVLALLDECKYMPGERQRMLALTKRLRARVAELESSE